MLVSPVFLDDFDDGGVPPLIFHVRLHHEDLILVNLLVELILPGVLFRSESACPCDVDGPSINEHIEAFWKLREHDVQHVSGGFHIFVRCGFIDFINGENTLDATTDPSLDLAGLRLLDLFGDLFWGGSFLSLLLYGVRLVAGNNLIK